jgi:hypothetical protein
MRSPKLYSGRLVLDISLLEYSFAAEREQLCW